MPSQIQILFCREKEGDIALLVKVWHDKGVSDAGFLEPNGALPRDNSGEGVYIPRGARLQSCILSSSVHTARVPKSLLRIKIQMLIVGNVCLKYVSKMSDRRILWKLLSWHCLRQIFIFWYWFCYIERFILASGDILRAAGTLACQNVSSPVSISLPAALLWAISAACRGATKSLLAARFGNSHRSLQPASHLHCCN